MAEQRPPFRPEQEVRFAVVMYGGASLAIYINGVAQELFRLVRATAPSKQLAADPDEVWFSSSGERGLSGSELVYRELGQMLPLPAAELAQPTADAAVRTRFVVDILSGSSAGGINAIFLAKAIAKQQSFDSLRDLWMQEADIGRLLYDKHSFDGITLASRPDQPESLLNGYRLYARALATLETMAESEEAPRDDFRPAYADELDLAVTATDLQGIAEPVRLTETSVPELRHRHVFRFSYSTEEATGEEQSDFGPERDPLLAFAARCTSSFPAAFEPVRADDVAHLRPDAVDGSWERWFPDHARANADWRRFSFADGGDLDNKPFSYATATLRRRRADVPVQRKLVYIEPHPAFMPGSGAGSPEMPAKERPDIFGSVAAAVVGLPRYETIREDVAAVADRNSTIERLREVTSRLDRAIPLEGDLLAPLHHRDPPGSDTEEDAALGRAAPSYRVYRELRARDTTDQLTRLACLLRGSAEDGDDAIRIGRALRDWVAEHEHDRLRAFVERFDTAGRHRRMSFLQDRVNDLLRRDEGSVRMLTLGERLEIPDIPQGRADDSGEAVLSEAAGAELAEAGGSLRSLKRALNESCDALRKAERAPRTQALDNVIPEGSEQRNRFDRLRDAARRLDCSDGRTTDFITAAEAFLAAPLRSTDEGLRERIEAASLPPWTTALLVAYDVCFETFDMVVLPLAYPDLGEANPVDILRISPEDSQSLYPESASVDPAEKLGGIRFGHFGGFLHAEWRQNDLLWGRLDAAEAIVKAVLPERHRASFLVRCQAAILREELAGDSATRLRAAVERRLERVPIERASDDALVDAFRYGFPGPGELDPGELRAVGRRTWKIGFGVLARASKRRKGLRKLSPPLRVIGAATPLAAIFGRRLLPRREQVRNWLPRLDRQWVRLPSRRAR